MSSPILLIDNSNSRTKFRLLSSGVISDELRVLPTRELTEARVRAMLEGWSFCAVCVSSVVPHSLPIFYNTFDCPVKIIRPDKNRYVDFSGYPGIGTLGADRVANAVAAAAGGNVPVVAVDLGSAITFDVVTASCDGECRFLGGVIAPGLSSFCSSLSEHTALLPHVEFDLDCRGVGLNTQQALQAGILGGFKGMIREILQRITLELGGSPRVVATGGDAALAASLLEEIHDVDPLLTFRGMALLCQTES